MKKFTSPLLWLAAVAVSLSMITNSCEKKGDFQVHEDGYTYKFHEINDTAAMPQMGDVVTFNLKMYMTDTILIPAAVNGDRIRESLYPGDLYAALSSMHTGDSATFIMNGDSIFHYYFGQEFPFEDKELKFDIRMMEITPSAEYEIYVKEQQAQYEKVIEQRRLEEDSVVLQFVKDNNITVKPNAEGLYIVKNGGTKGAKITKGADVSIHYTGKFVDGTVFDSSYSRNEPITIKAGEGQVIPGWDKALLQLSQGEKVTLVIPSALAYGANGVQNAIPPYTPLVFDMEIIEVK